MEIQARLDHPNIVKCHQVYQNSHKTYIVLEYCECSLQDMVSFHPDRRSGISSGLSIGQIRHYLVSMLNVLDYCSSLKLVHRDVKPSNLLLADNRCTLKLSDFGVVLDLETMSGIPSATYADLPTVGSLSFQSPELLSERYREVILTEDLLLKIDIWAAGITLYFMMTGDLPFRGESVLGLFQAIESGLYVLPADFPDPLVDILSQMLIVDPHRRPLARQLLAHPWIDVLDSHLLSNR